MRLLFLSLVVSYIPCHCIVAQESNDPIASELTKAKESYAKVVAEARDSLLGAYKQKIEDVAKTGNLQEVKVIQGEMDTFEKSGLLPKSSKVGNQVQTYLATTRKARVVLQAEYETAVKSYTKALRVDKAEGIQSELKTFVTESKSIGAVESERHELAGTYLMKWRGGGANDELFIIDGKGNLTRNISPTNKKGGVQVGMIELKNGEYTLKGGGIERFSIANGRLVVEQFQSSKFDSGKQGDPSVFGIGERIKNK